MKKISIIIQREYLTRVRKRSFILLTLLIPILFIGISVLIGVLAVSSTGEKKVAIVDESGLFTGKLEDTKTLRFTFEQRSLDSIKNNLSGYGYDAVLSIPRFNINENASFLLFYDNEIGLDAQGKIEDKLNSVVSDIRIRDAGISPDQLKVISSGGVKVTPFNIKEGKESNNAIGLVIGYVCGFLLYMFMLFYGMSVMRSVMEEKTNRIAEIIVSSVRPFQLMLGKIIGVALVGLTQFLLWIVLLGIFAAISTPLLGSLGTAAVDPAAMTGVVASSTKQGEMLEVMKMLQGQNWLMIGGWFIFYFLGGYFLYASLFAAVGSLVNEDPQESNQLTMPITIPIILGFVIMSTAIKDPNSGLAVFGSIFPLTSPIVMMARIPFGVPAWELILSAVLLVCGFIATTWMAGKISRTGILLYGKKVTFKEIGKWLVRK